MKRKIALFTALVMCVLSLGTLVIVNESTIIMPEEDLETIYNNIKNKNMSVEEFKNSTERQYLEAIGAMNETDIYEPEVMPYRKEKPEDQILEWYYTPASTEDENVSVGVTVLPLQR